MRVIFMGTPDYASLILETLIAKDNVEVVACYTQPDKPVGRKKVLTQPPVKVVALENSIEVIQPNRLRDEDVVEHLLKIACDYIVVAAYGQLLPKAVLDHAPCINLHASILPQYRGASPIQQTLLNGDEESGVTAMLMDVGMDTGDILKIDRIRVGDDEMVASLFERLTATAAELTCDVLDNFETLTPIAQNSDEASYCKKITKQDGELTLCCAAEDYNKYRAYTPWPGVFLNSGLKLKKISMEKYCQAGTPGKIIEVSDESVVIECETGRLRIYTLQPPSKKEMSAVAYLNGKRLTLDDILA